MPFGFLFSGQGSQEVGMGAELCERSPAAREVFDLACEVVGYDIRKICFEGPAEELNTTRVSQPAIMAVSLAHLRASEGLPPHSDVVAAGLSLGEYTALAAAGAVSEKDALDLVRTRGELMQEACDRNPGGMLSIIGLAKSKVEEIVHEASSRGVVGISNVNSPTQIAVGGTGPALERVDELAQKAGAQKVVKLNVAGAFHTALMAGARDKLKEKILRTPFRKPRFPIISNVSADYTADPMEIRENLVNQLTSPVLWSDSMLLMINDGVHKFFEFGPGNVLTGLLRRIDKSVECRKP